MEPMKFKTPDFYNPSELVTFYIGEEETIFSVHKEVACQHSPVLKAALNSDFTEGKTQTYSLKDTSKEAFRFLTQWMYTGRMNFLDHSSDEMEKRKGRGRDGDEHYVLCTEQDFVMIQLWILADMLLIDDVQNEVVDQLGQVVRECGVDDRHFNYLYEHTAPGSQLRAFQVYHCVLYHALDFEAESCPKEFLLDVIRFLERRASNWEEWEASNMHKDISWFYVFHALPEDSAKSIARIAPNLS